MWNDIVAHLANICFCKVYFKGKKVFKKILKSFFQAKYLCESKMEMNWNTVYV